ncbi:MAG: S16 family serine protease [Bacillota bacterium]|nr:S16 family serine protease [Bacillota bacterium]
MNHYYKNKIRPVLKNSRLVQCILAIMVLFVLGLFIRIDYYIMRPSRAVELRPIITVENADPDDHGIFYLVTVNQQRATVTTALFAYFHPYMDLRPAERVIPTGMDEEEYRELLEEYMIESQMLAQVVALRRSGYQVEIVSDGVEVVGFLENAPAEDYLMIGDRILEVDGDEVFLASEVSLLVQNREAGEEVTLAISRNGTVFNITAPTGARPDDETIPQLGIYIRTLPWEPIIPLDIDMETGNIGGPSAGLMFVLEIINQIVPEDISAGKMIAGTGSIDLQERVGTIGGVVQKVVAAERAGAEYFILPRDNYEEAKTAARNIALIPVDNLDEVLEFLSSL